MCFNYLKNISDSNIEFYKFQFQFNRSDISLTFIVLSLASMLALYLLFGFSYNLGLLVNRMVVTFGIAAIIFAFYTSIGSIKPVPSYNLFTISDLIYLVVFATVIFTLFSVIGAKKVKKLGSIKIENNKFNCRNFKKYTYTNDGIYSGYL